MRSFDSLVFISYGAIGDFLVSTTFINAFKEKWPCSRIFVATTRGKDFLSEFAKIYPYIEVIDLNTKVFFTKAGLHILKGKTAVYVPPTFGRTSIHIKFITRIMSFMIGSYNFGFKEKNKASRFLDHVETFDLDALQVDNLMKFFPSLGISVPHYEMKYRYNLQSCSVSDHPYVLLHPFGSNVKRSIPLSWIPKIISIIRAIKPGIRIVISGGPADVPKAEKIKTLLSDNNVELRCGDNSVHDLVCMVQSAILYVGVDTGITHLAAMLKKKSLVLANASNPAWLPSYNEHAIILMNKEHCTCTRDKRGDCQKEIDGEIYYRCLAEIKMETIEENLRNLLN
jgi:heptosyltransferase-3